MAAKIDMDELIERGVYGVDPESGEIVQLRSQLTPDGMEIPDSTPMSAPVGFSSDPRDHQTLKDIIQFYMRQGGQDFKSGIEETFEEADDFDVGEPDRGVFDDWEDHFDRVRAAEEYYENQRKAQQPPAAGSPAPGVPKEQGGEGGAATPPPSPDSSAAEPPLAKPSLGS